MSVKKGRRFEEYVMDKLKERDFYCVRSAGSKGVFDLLAVKNGVPWGIQCKKAGKITKRELEELRETGRKYGIIPCLAKKEGRRVVVICLYNDRDILAS